METRALGFAKPISIDSIAPGMLLSSSGDDGERIIGISFATEHDTGLVVVWSNRDGDVPRAQDLDARFSYGLIEGVLEIEPEDIQDAFVAPVKLSGADTGLILTAEGGVGAAILVSPFGRPTRAYIDLSTGKPAGRSDGIALLPFYRLWVRQDGRKDRWPLVNLNS